MKHAILLIASICTIVMPARGQNLTGSLPDKEPSVNGGRYRCIDMVRTINGLRRMGKAKALDTLREWSKTDDWQQNARVHFICRLLFVKPDGWRPPMIGGADPPVDQAAADSCAIFPLAQSDGVPFLLVDGHMLGGFAEPATNSVNACNDLNLISDDLPVSGYSEAAEDLINSKVISRLYNPSQVSQIEQMIRNQAAIDEKSPTTNPTQ